MLGFAIHQCLYYLVKVSNKLHRMMWKVRLWLDLKKSLIGRYDLNLQLT